MSATKRPRDEAGEEERSAKRRRGNDELELMDMGHRSEEEEERGARKRVRFAEVENSAEDARAERKRRREEDTDYDDSASIVGGDSVRSFKEDYERRVRTGEDVADDSVTPFHMDEELSRGHFDPKTGGYVSWRRNAGEQDESDEEDEAWLLDYDKAKRRGVVQMDRVLDVFARPSAQRSGSNSGAQKSAGEGEDLPTLLRKITAVLQEGETVGRAMKRLRPKKASGKQARDKKKKKKEGDAMEEEEEGKQEELNKRALNSLIELANECLEHHYSAVYEDTREQMLAKMGGYVNDGATASSHTETAATSGASAADAVESAGVMWEYRVNSEESNVFGPFTTPQMVEWAKGGYFQSNPTVEARIVGRESFNPAKRIEFEDYLDD